MEYNLLTKPTAIDFLNYYEKRLFNFGTHVPISNLWSYLNGKLALDADHFENIYDKDHGAVLRFYYTVLDYKLVFDVWDYNFKMVDGKRLCLIDDGSVHVVLTKPAYKVWHSWLWLDRLLLPFIMLCMLITVSLCSILLYELMHNLAWYLTLGCIFLLLGCVILTVYVCVHYWKNHKYLKLWLKATSDSEDTDNLERD